MKSKLTVDYHEYLIKSLRGPKEAASYLDAVLDEGDSKLLLKALRNVAEAQGGMGKVAARAKLNRVSLYRMLSDQGNPEWFSLKKLFSALGMKLNVVPEVARKKRAKAA